MKSVKSKPMSVLSALVALVALATVSACGGTETVVQTVIVKEQVPVEVLVTVQVEKEVVVQGETVVEKVEVEKQVIVEKEVTPTPDPRALKDVPRNRTLVITHWSDSYRTQHDNVENFNWYLPGNSHARHAAAKGLIEYQFYTNPNTGGVYNWLGESFEYNDTLDAIDVRVRDGVKWSDGVPFTAHDVKFTIDMVIAGAPELYRSALWADQIESVSVHDDLNLTIDLTRPDPRFFGNQFATPVGAHSPIVPKHVW